MFSSGSCLCLRQKPRSVHFDKKAALLSKTTQYQLQEVRINCMNKNYLAEQRELAILCRPPVMSVFIKDSPTSVLILMENMSLFI
jgi:hypothetical protein